MKYEPAPHHLAGIDWLYTHQAAALWTDMGSGKTGMTATVVDRLFDEVEISRCLVIGTPRIAAKVWRDEINKWDHLSNLRWYHITAEDLEVSNVKVERDGQERTIQKITNPTALRSAIYRRQAEVFTIHYDLVPRLVKLFGDKWPFDCVVMDESSMVSNQDTARFRALRRVRGKIRRLYQLTGTPASNGLEKLYAQVHLLDGGKRLGRTLTEFRVKFMMPAVIDQRSGRVFKWTPRPGAREMIYEAVKDICLSLPTDEWANLPPRVLNVIPVTLPPKARRLYDEVEAEYIATLENGAVVEAATAAVLGLKLMQICNGTVYDDEGEPQIVHSAKLEVLEELVETVDGQLLLAYWFKHDRDRIKKHFRKAVDLNDDDMFEEKWNAGQVGMGMMQPSSGGHGLNLQDGGSLAAWYGPIHNLEVYLQFNKRLHRPGQKSDRVVIHHLICEDTIEEDVMQSLGEKEDEQEALLLAVQRRVNRKLGRVE